MTDEPGQPHSTSVEARPPSPADPDAGRTVHDLAELMSALAVQDRRNLEELVDGRVDLDGWIDWDDVDETEGITVGVRGRGTTLEYPFAVDELWDTLDELEDEVIAGLEDEARQDPDLA